MNFPSTVRDYAEAVADISSGHFTSKFKEESRENLASIFGAPFFAASRLAPDVLEKTTAHIVFAGSVQVYSLEGGRWLSLYSKALRAPSKLECTVCVQSRSRSARPPKPILFQPPQHVVTKNWAQHLRENAASTDLVIFYCPESFGECQSALDDIAALVHERRVLFALGSRPEAVVLKQLAMLRGYEVSDILAFEKEPGVHQQLAIGAWWIGATSRSAERPASDVEEAVAPWRAAHRAYRACLNMAGSRSAASEVATYYAMRGAVHVEGSEISDAVYMTPDEGIDLGSGRWFGRQGNGETERNPYEWRAAQLDEDLLDLMPSEEGLSEDEKLGQRMTWLARAIAEQEQRNENLIGRATVEQEQEVCSADSSRASQEEAIEEPLVAGASPEKPTILPASSPRPLRSRLSRGAGTIDVAAFAARLGTGKPLGDSFEKARTRILNWLRDKGFSGFSASGGSHIEKPHGEVSVETDGRSIWSMRFDDRRQMELGAFWRVELALLQVGTEHPAIGLRLFQVRQKDDAPAPISGIPNVIPAIATEIGMQDAGFPLYGHALVVQERLELQRLLQLMLNSERSQSVVVVASKTLSKADSSLDRLASRLIGVAHVVFIAPSVAATMIDRLGRERSVFGNAIRLYRPGFSLESDPFLHRVWTYGGGQLPIRVADDIAEEVFAISLEGGDIDERAPSFITMRNLLSEGRLRRLEEEAKSIATTAQEERGRQEAIRRELEGSLKEYKDQCSALERNVRELNADLQATRRERDTALDDARQLRNQLENRWSENATEAAESEDQSYYPDNWDELDDWVEIYGEGRLVVLAQAAKAARESPFKDVSFVYRVLEFLVQRYVPLRNRAPDDIEVKEAYDHAMAELGVDVSPVGMAVEDKRYKREYRRYFDGSEIKLDMHVKRSVGFDSASIFRLYFHYDEDNSRVIIGHMPTHLTNRITHSG
jgi:hypothetical protein